MDQSANPLNVAADWFWIPRPQPAGTARIVCFPCLGADASLYRGWPGRLESWFEIVAVRLPGRGARRREEPIVELDELAGEIARAVDRIADEPYALFGYSMGALLAFEVARKLRRMGAPAPTTLFVAASRPPESAGTRLAEADASDERLVELLRSVGGTPEEVLTSPELLVHVLPTVRVDVRVLASYRHVAEAPLATPIVAISGDDDHLCPPARMTGWGAHSSVGFRHVVVSGGHDFVQELEAEVTDIVAASLAHERGGR